MMNEHNLKKWKKVHQFINHLINPQKVHPCWILQYSTYQLNLSSHKSNIDGDSVTQVVHVELKLSAKKKKMKQWLRLKKKMKSHRSKWMWKVSCTFIKKIFFIHFWHMPYWIIDLLSKASFFRGILISYSMDIKKNYWGGRWGMEGEFGRDGQRGVKLWLFFIDEA